MSLPWDPANIAENLRTLSRLHRGDHLSILKEGENLDEGTYTLDGRGLRSRFKIEGKARQAFVRSKKGETILNDQQYFYPLKKFFSEAASAWSRNQVSSDLVKGGYEGLKKLRDTYASDRTRRAKLEEILQAVDSELRGIRVQGIVLDAGISRFILGEQQLPTMNQWIMGRLLEPNEGLSEEYAVDADPAFLKTVFGINPPIQAPTIVPIRPRPYRRRTKGMGFCHQYYRDAHQGHAVLLQGKEITCSAEHLAELYAFVDKDEGLMFAVTQFATQAGVSGIPNLLLLEGGMDGNRRTPLIQFGYERLVFSIGGGNCDITKQGGGIRIDSTLDIPGDRDSFGLTERGMRGPFPLRSFGISNIHTEFGATLRRNHNRIDVQLCHATIRIITIAPRVELTGPVM